jgi:hypothetical protein
VQLVNGAFGYATVVVVDEGEPARAPGLAIGRHHDLNGLADGAKVLPDIGFGRAVREVPDE